MSDELAQSMSKPGFDPEKCKTAYYKVDTWFFTSLATDCLWEHTYELVGEPTVKFPLPSAKLNSTLSSLNDSSFSANV